MEYQYDDFYEGLNMGLVASNSGLDLNPDEGVWSLLKRRLANGRPDTLSELMDALSQQICDVASSQRLLRGCILQSDLPFFDSIVALLMWRFRIC